MKVYIFFLSLLFLTSCGNTEKIDPNTVIVNTTKNKDILSETYNIYVQDEEYTLGKYEPNNKKYLGIYTDSKEGNFVKETDSYLNTNHAIYVYNMKLDEEFPLSWVLNCYSNYKTPFVNLYAPSNFQDTFNLEILEDLSKQFGNLKIPIFLNFYPITKEFLNKPYEYIEFYKEAKSYFNVNAENVSFVWSIDSDLVQYIDQFYPEDGYVDWVGINIYEQINKSNQLEKVLQNLDYFYNKFQEEKPIAISQLGISHFSNQSFKYKIEDKTKELERFYKNIPEKYSRIKMINYMNFNNFRNIEENKQNYLLTDNKDILKTYRILTKNDMYKEQLYINSPNEKVRENFKLPFLAYKKEDMFFVEENFIRYLGYDEYINNAEKYENLDLYKLNSFASFSGLNLELDQVLKNILIKR